MFRKISVLFVLALAACGGGSGTVDHGDRFRGSDVVVSPAGRADCAALPAAQVAEALRLTNARRASSGLSPLSTHPRLMEIAAKQSCHQASSGVMSHAGPRNEGPKDRARAAGYAPRVISENIASGPYSVTQAVSAWNASSAHLGNIMIPQLKHFGIGSAVGPNGFVYWTGVYADGS